MKKFTIGFEVEFLIIDKKTGMVAPGIESILKKVEEKTGDKNNSILTESAKELIEVGSYPNVEGPNTMKSLLSNLKLLTYAADEVGLAVLPLGTYPGKFVPTILNNKRYNLYMKLFHKNRFKTWGRCAGYHCHYALPWGVFDTKRLTLKELGNSKNQESLVNSYNFLIALDPVLTTFMQSSPFYQGHHMAKDSRMIVLRSDKELGDFQGWQSTRPIFSSLPSYVHTGTDISHLAEKRKTEWLKTCEEAGVKEKEAMAPFRSLLSLNWSPLRVNPHGTFEHRGMDMNRLPVLFSVSILIQTLLRNIQERHLNVVPHDSAKEEPFSFKKKTIYIPPDTYVKQHLQKLSTYEGLASDEMLNYCKRAITLAQSMGGKQVMELLKPLNLMLDERQTTSDKILTQARELGHKNMKKIIPQNVASKIALSHAKQMFEDIVLLQEMIETNERLSA